MANRAGLTAAIAVASILGAGALVLQRWVAATKLGAIALVAVWFLIVAAGALIWLRGRRELRAPVLGTIGLALVAAVAIGYWTGFRDHEVNEDVLMASRSARASEQAAGLAGATKPERTGKGGGPEAGPVSLASGSFAGQDGHAGTGKAEVVQAPDGSRQLVFTDFDVDPGVDVAVYLTPDTAGVEDRVDLGGLNGNVGDQQYEIPPDTDLARYDSVVLWCKPFTVRIATAELA